MKRPVSRAPSKKRRRTHSKARLITLIPVHQTDNLPIRADKKFHYVKYKIIESPCTIGYGDHNKLTLRNFSARSDGEPISMDHAILTWTAQGRWVLTNKGRFGTGVNGKPLGQEESAALCHGDQLVFGFYSWDGMIQTSKYGWVRNLAHYRVEFADAAKNEIEEMKRRLAEMEKMQKQMEKERQVEIEKAEMKKRESEKKQMVQIKEMREELEKEKRKVEEREKRLKVEHDAELKRIAAEKDNSELKALAKDEIIQKQQKEFEKREKAKTEELESAFKKAAELETQQAKLSEEKRLKMGNLEEANTCSICFDWMVFPVATRCGHSYCKICILEWSKKRQSCPDCECDLEVNDVILFKTQETIDVLAGQDVEYMKKKRMHQEWLLAHERALN